MIDSYLRLPYQKYLVDPLAKKIANSTITPTLITIASLSTGILAAILISYEWTFTGVLFLLISGYCDTLDGSVARESKKSSPQGAVLDILSDRIVEFSMVFALFSLAPETRGFPCLLMLGSILICITSFLVVGIFEQNSSEKSFHYSPGIMERTEAFTFFIGLAVFPPLFFPLAILFTTLVTLTGALRAMQFVLK